MNNPRCISTHYEPAGASTERVSFIDMSRWHFDGVLVVAAAGGRIPRTS